MRTYLSERDFREVVESFEWPAAYTIENDLPDGMILRLPGCTLYFAEGFEGDMRLEFLPEDTGFGETLGLAHVMMVTPPASGHEADQAAQRLFRDESPTGSVDKVRHGVHDICVTLLARLQHVLRGDFSWVQRYRATTGR